MICVIPNTGKEGMSILNSLEFATRCKSANISNPPKYYNLSSQLSPPRIRVEDGGKGEEKYSTTHRTWSNNQEEPSRLCEQVRELEEKVKEIREDYKKRENELLERIIALEGNKSGEVHLSHEKTMSNSEEILDSQYNNNHHMSAGRLIPKSIPKLSDDINYMSLNTFHSEPNSTTKAAAPLLLHSSHSIHQATQTLQNHSHQLTLQNNIYTQYYSK